MADDCLRLVNSDVEKKEQRNKWTFRGQEFVGSRTWLYNDKRLFLEPLKDKAGWNVWGHWEGEFAIEKVVRRFRGLLWAEKWWNHFGMLAANRKENKTSLKSSTQIVWVAGGKPAQTAANIQRGNMNWELSRQYSRISLCNWWRCCCQGLKTVYMLNIN